MIKAIIFIIMFFVIIKSLNIDNFSNTNTNKLNEKNIILKNSRKVYEYNVESYIILNELDINKIFGADDNITIHISENYIVKLLYHSNKLIENKYVDTNLLSKGEYEINRIINNNVLEQIVIINKNNFDNDSIYYTYPLYNDNNNYSHHYHDRKILFDNEHYDLKKIKKNHLFKKFKKGHY